MSRAYRDYCESQIDYFDDHDPADCDDPAATDEFYRRMEAEMTADLKDVPIDFPTDEELIDMALKAGYDEFPF